MSPPSEPQDPNLPFKAETRWKGGFVTYVQLYVFLAPAGWTLMALMQTFHLANLIFLIHQTVIGMQIQVGIAPEISLFPLISCEQQRLWAEDLSGTKYGWFGDDSSRMFPAFLGRRLRALAIFANSFLQKWSKSVRLGGHFLCTQVWSAQRCSLGHYPAGPFPNFDFRLVKPTFYLFGCMLVGGFLHWKVRLIFIFRSLPEAFVPNLTGIWNVMNIPVPECDAATTAPLWCLYTKHRFQN